MIIDPKTIYGSSDERIHFFFSELTLIKVNEATALPEKGVQILGGGIKSVFKFWEHERLCGWWQLPQERLLPQENWDGKWLGDSYLSELNDTKRPRRPELL